MLVDIVIAIAGILVFLYLFWRRIKEDYSSNMIFSTAFFTIIGIVAGSLLGHSFLSLWWFWTSFLGGALGLTLGIFKFKLRFLETIEAGTVSLMPWVVFIFWADSIKSSSIVSFVYSVGIVALIGLYYFLDHHYKEFSWYKSGRVGFAGLTTAGIFFALRAAIAIFSPNVLSFAGRGEALVSALSAFIFFFMTYNLSRSEI